MKQILLSIFFFAATLLSSAQTASLFWAKQYGGPDAHQGNAIAKDQFGNIITTGYFEGFADFNPGTGSVVLTSAGGKDAYVGKLNSNGDFAWAVRFGGSGSDMGLDVATDYLGNVIVVGEFTGSMDADPGANAVMLSGNADGPSGFVIKLDASGNHLWSAAFSSTGSGTSTVSPSTIHVDTNGNITIGGGMGVPGQVDFNPGAGTSFLDYNYKLFILKLTASGAFASVIGMEGYAGYEAKITDIEVDAQSNIFYCGYFASIIDFDPSATDYEINGNGPTDAFVCKLNSAGVFQWLSYLYDDSGITCSSMDMDNDGSIYMTGIFGTSADFDPDLFNTFILENLTGYAHAFLLKLNNDGTFIYAKDMAAGTPSTCNDVVHDADNNVYITGSYSGPTDLNPDDNASDIHASSGANDVFVTKLDGDGGFEYAISFGGGNWDDGRSLVYDNTTNTYSMTGFFGNTIDADPSSEVYNLTTGGGYDAFIIKYGQCTPIAATFDAVGCGSYEWNQQIYTTDGTYQQTLIASSGCDSVVTLNLNIASTTSSSQNFTSCGQFIFHGNEYPESGNYSVIIPNTEGCDSIINFTLDVTLLQDISVVVDGNTLNCDQGESRQWVICTSETYTPIDGATGVVYNPTASGSYAVQVTYGACTEYSSCVDFTYIGVDENVNSSNFKVYPNPATDVLSISTSKNFSNTNIRIINSTGSVVMNRNVNGNRVSLNVSSLASGIYFIQCESDGVMMQERFVKE